MHKKYKKYEQEYYTLHKIDEGGCGEVYLKKKWGKSEIIVEKLSNYIAREQYNKIIEDKIENNENTDNDYVNYVREIHILKELNKKEETKNT